MKYIKIKYSYPYTNIYIEGTLQEIDREYCGDILVQTYKIKSNYADKILLLCNHILLNKIIDYNININKCLYYIKFNDAVQILNMCNEIINLIMDENVDISDIIDEYKLVILL